MWTDNIKTHLLKRPIELIWFSLSSNGRPFMERVIRFVVLSYWSI